MKKITVNLEPLSYSVREEIKTLRTNILFCGNDKQIIMVTSSFMGEGKTRISSRLAIALSEIKKKVLLLDLDLRKSVMISRLGVEKVDKGMTHFLSGQCPLSEVIMSTDIPRLHVAFAGPAAPNPTELLSSESFTKMLESFRSVYDYIIIDSPPLGMVVDGVILAKHSDGAVMVLESGSVKYRIAQDVKEKIEGVGCPLLGVVLNKVDYKKNGRYYSKYYGKYYGKHYDKYYDADEENGEEVQ